MGKPKRKNKKSQHKPPPPPDLPTILASLDEHVTQIDGADSAAAGPLWGAVHKLLLLTELDKTQAMGLIGRRDLDGLRKAIRVLSGVEEAVESPDAGPAVHVDEETKRSAMKAFRKRLKLTRLDHESKLGVGPMSGGKESDIDAIMAPRDFGDDVWIALVASGELRAVGSGFYRLASE